jgi:hypothetical protein
MTAMKIGSNNNSKWSKWMGMGMGMGMGMRMGMGMALCYVI